MLMPKRVKYRKMQKGKMRGKAYRGAEVSFGEYGLKAMECGWLTSNQIEAARVTINRTLQRRGKLWIRIFPDKPITKKPAVIKPGRVLFELEGLPADLAKQAMDLASYKLPMKTKFVSRDER